MRAASLGNSPLQVTSPFFVVTSRLAVFTCGSENILAFTAVVICWSLGAFEQAAASPRTITSATSKIADLRIVPPCCIEPSRGPEGASWPGCAASGCFHALPSLYYDAPRGPTGVSAPVSGSAARLSEAGKATGVAAQGLRSGAAEKKALGASHLAVEANE